MDERDRYAKGMEVRRAVLGDAHVDRAESKRSAFNEEFQELIAAAMLPMAASALAQTPTYPDKPIRIIVPFPAGGVADTFGREIGKRLTEAWGQPVLIDNRPGAGGNIGADIVAKSRTAISRP